MTRRDLIWKWTAYGAALVLVFLAQAYVLSRLPLAGVTAALLPLAVTACGVLEGAASGAGLGAAAGVLSMAFFHGGYEAIAAYALAGLVVGLAARYVLRQDFWGCLICAAAVLLLRGGCLVLPRLVGETAPLSVLLEVAGPEFLYSYLFTGPVYLLFRFVCRRFGRIALA